MNTRVSGGCSCWSITCCPRLAEPAAAVLASRCSTPAGRSWKSINSSVISRISARAPTRYGGFFEYDRKLERLEEVGRELEDPAVWSDPARAQELGRERARLTSDVGAIDRTSRGIAEAGELLELAEAEGDESAARDIEHDAQRLKSEVRHLELKRMFRQEMDSHNAFLDIQAGAGGTEAQDWAQM